MDKIERPEAMSEGRVFVVLPVFRADPDYFREQVHSLEIQSADRVFVVFVDADRASRQLIDGTAASTTLAYHIAEPDTSLDSYRAFEFGLKVAFDMSKTGDVFALCDQDDIWRDDRLELGIRKLSESGVDLVHSDARIVGPSGQPRQSSLHRLEGRLGSPNLRGLLLRNNVTGMTTTLSRHLIKAALPFPSQAATFFHHDLWLALVARALGGIAFLDKPLVDYRQHRANVVGAIENRPAQPRFGSALWRRKRAGDYFVAAYLAKCLYLRMTEVAELDPARVNRKALNGLSPYLAIGGAGSAFLWDAVLWFLRARPSYAVRSATYCGVRCARLLWGLRKLLPQHLLPALVDFDRRGFAMAPGTQPVAHGNQIRSDACTAKLDVSEFHDIRTEPKFTVKFDGSYRDGLVVLLPTLNPSEIFAGIATAIDFGIGIAAKGRKVRFIACDLPITSPSSSRAFIHNRATTSTRADELMKNIDVICGVTNVSLPFSRSDQFLATAWWSAHVARDLIDRYGFNHKKFFYLIQDFEPNFYPWGDECAAATESYNLPHVPIFNTTLLRDYFVNSGIGQTTAADIAFRPSINVASFAALQRPGASRKRIVVYGRPEVPRNLFPTAMLALSGFVERAGLTPQDTEILSVGYSHSDVVLANGVIVKSIGKVPWSEYPSFLASADLGLALMLSPHPSHLPIELAASGARVVTNGFGGKDLSCLSTAILSASPNEHALADALHRAWTMPPVSHRERQVDIAQLGVHLNTAVDGLEAALNGNAYDVPLKKSA